MKPTILLVFGGDSECERTVLAPLDPEFIQMPDCDHPDATAALARADALIVALQRVDGALLDRAPNCKIVSRLGVGFDTIDIPAATQRGVQVTYVPDYGVDEVSAQAIALIMACMRGVVQQANDTRAGKWNGISVAPVKRLRDSTCGVVGFGRIGRETGLKARGLGFRVLVYDPLVDPANIRAAGCEPVSFEQLLAESDYVTLHTPLSEGTRHLINAKTLRLMKPTAYLVNTARGGLVDEAALIEALDAGVLKGAGIDVLQKEPPPPDHPFLHHPKIIVTPHFSFYSEEAVRELHTRGAEEVLRKLTGQPPRCPLNKVGA